MIYNAAYQGRRWVNVIARSLDAIIQELDAGYAPSRKLINERIAAIPASADAEVAGLQAQLGQANEQILGQARDRGLGFAGIPIAEQAKYAATSFAPAVARVRQSANDQKTSLFDALNNTNLEQRKYATSIQQNEFNLDEQKRQFEAAQQAAREAEARARAASGGGGGGGFSLASLLGGGGDLPAVQAKPSAAEQAYLNVQGFLSKGRSAAESDYLATLNSANRGNAHDKLKVEAYRRAGIGGNLPNVVQGQISGGLSSGGGVVPLFGNTNGGLRLIR